MPVLVVKFNVRSVIGGCLQQVPYVSAFLCTPTSDSARYCCREYASRAFAPYMHFAVCSLESMPRLRQVGVITAVDLAYRMTLKAEATREKVTDKGLNITHYPKPQVRPCLQYLHVQCTQEQQC